MLGRAAERMFESIDGAGYTLRILLQTARWSHAIPRKRGVIMCQMSVCATGGFTVAMIVAIFSGMVLALQAGISLRTWGQQELVGLIVPASMVREMGPVMTGFILAGLIGSTMAAEVGTMSVSEEIDALNVMSIDPVYFLVLPRVIALAVVAPLLTVYVDLVGILGGAFVGRQLLDISYSSYFHNAREALELKDLYSGLVKAAVFGVLIAAVGCSQGLRARGGAEGVGRATMRTVVVCFVYILMFDYILTWMFY
jgi:phospholipid/cholesterol/gamma-HCH transport system permease protein